MIQKIYKRKVGEFDCTIFRDLMFTYAAKDYFTNVKAEDLQNSLKRYQQASDTLDVPYVVMLLERGEQKILIDSGIGFSEKPIQLGETDFYLQGEVKDLLLSEGIKPSAITDVIISHFHPDHIGGIFSDGVLNYPNATFHLPEKEWNFWHSSAIDNFPPIFKLFIDNNITPLKKHNINLVKGDFTSIFPGILAVDAIGHSAGQIALLIGEGSEKLFYTADTFLHPLHIENSNWQPIFDFDHKQSQKTRLKIATLASENDYLVQSFHFDFPGLGRINKNKSNWHWEQLQFDKK